MSILNAEHLLWTYIRNESTPLQIETHPGVCCVINFLDFWSEDLKKWLRRTKIFRFVWVRERFRVRFHHCRLLKTRTQLAEQLADDELAARWESRWAFRRSSRRTRWADLHWRAHTYWTHTIIESADYQRPLISLSTVSMLSPGRQCLPYIRKLIRTRLI